MFAFSQFKRSLQFTVAVQSDRNSWYVLAEMFKYYDSIMFLHQFFKRHPSHKLIFK